MNGNLAVVDKINSLRSMSGNPFQARRNLKRAALLALIVALCLLPLGIGEYFQFVVNTILVYCLVAVGLNLLIGYLGQLAFASSGFFGIGAYAAGLSMVHLNLPFPLAVGAGILAGGAFGALVGMPALRVRGYYLAILTLAFGGLVQWVYVNGGNITFGASGFAVPSVSLFGFQINQLGKYYFFLAATVVGIGTTSLLLRSRFGRAFVAVRNNEQAAASLGINVKVTKIIAFAWSGAITGLAGVMFAVLNGRVSPDTFGISQELFHFTIVMVGGLGSLSGSVIGALVVTGLPELLRDFPGLKEIIFSLLLILVLFLMPKGIGGILEARVPWLRERLYREKDA